MSALTGTGPLVRHLLRRERFIAPAWMALLVLMGVGTFHQYGRVFPTEQARQGFAEFLRHNGLTIAFGGQLATSTQEGLAAWKIGDVLYCLIALMAVLTVVRHTRAEEESGRYELLAAGVVGRYAPLTATLLVACGASVLTGLLSALGWILSGCDPVGSLAFGCAIAAPGCVFAAVAAVAAQLSETARMATGLSLSFLGLGYMLRFAADGSGLLWLKWLSPLGWSHLVQPFADNRWGVLLLPLLATAVGAGTACFLVSHRDLGAGVLPARPGAAQGPGLRSPLALAWRLQRGLLLGWIVAYAAFGVLAGGLANGVWEAGRVSPWLQELYKRYGGGPETPFVDVFLWVLVMSLGYTATLQPILAASRLRSEEESGRAELVLATSVSRVRWMASHLVFVLLGPVGVMASAGLAVGVVHGRNTGALALQVPRILAAALIQVPAIWVVGGVAVLAYGTLPRFATAISWTTFLFINVFGEVLGPILRIDYEVADQAIPFHYIPKILSGGAFTPTPVLALTALAVLMGTVGTLALRHRDLG